MMKNKRTILLAAVLTAGLPLVAAAQTGSMPHGHGSMMQSGEEASPSQTCHAMMARHQEMQEKMKAMNAELDGLTVAMRSARGKAKEEATAAVVEKLVEQHKAITDMMLHQQPMMMMMGQMLGHMGESEGMSRCPMMQEMMRGDAGGQESPGGHSEHHPD